MMRKLMLVLLLAAMIGPRTIAGTELVRLVYRAPDNSVLAIAYDQHADASIAWVFIRGKASKPYELRWLAPPLSFGETLWTNEREPYDWPQLNLVWSDARDGYYLLTSFERSASFVSFVFFLPTNDKAVEMVAAERFDPASRYGDDDPKPTLPPGVLAFAVINNITVDNLSGKLFISGTLDDEHLRKTFVIDEKTRKIEGSVTGEVVGESTESGAYLLRQESALAPELPARETEMKTTLGHPVAIIPKPGLRFAAEVPGARAELINPFGTSHLVVYQTKKDGSSTVLLDSDSDKNAFSMCGTPGYIKFYGLWPTRRGTFMVTAGGYDMEGPMKGISRPCLLEIQP